MTIEEFEQQQAAITAQIAEHQHCLSIDALARLEQVTALAADALELVRTYYGLLMCVPVHDAIPMDSIAWETQRFVAQTRAYALLYDEEKEKAHDA